MSLIQQADQAKYDRKQALREFFFDRTDVPARLHWAMTELFKPYSNGPLSKETLSLLENLQEQLENPPF